MSYLKVIDNKHVKLPKGVICRTICSICDIGFKNVSNQVYEDALWEQVFSDTSLTEKISSRELFGCAGRNPGPYLTNVSHVVCDMWKDAVKVYQKIDILDTDEGRMVKHLLDGGLEVSAVIRGEGKLEESTDDSGDKYTRVIPESYHYITTDLQY